MRSRSIAALTVGLVLITAGCATDAAGPDPAPTPAPTPAPAPSPQEDPPASEEPEPTDVVAAYLVRSAPTTFFVEPVPVRVPAVGDALSARVSAAVEALLALEGTADPGLATSVPAGTTLRGVSVADGVVTLDLAGGIVGSSGSSSQETTFAQQLAHTARVEAGLDAVALLVDGAPVSELWGHLDWSQPIAADAFALSPVTITTPLAGEEVAVGEVTVRGQATVFEATVLVDLLDAEGTVLVEDFVTATTGAPDRGSWEWTVTLSGPGTYTLRASETDPSEGEGRPPFVATRTLRAVG